MALLRKLGKKSENETAQLPIPESGPGAEQALADLDGLDANQEQSDSDSGGRSESEAIPDDEDDTDDLMSIFESEEVEDGDLTALTGSLEDVDMDSVLHQSREVLDLLSNGA